MERRYVEIRVRLIANVDEHREAVIVHIVRDALFDNDLLDVGELEVKVAVGDSVQVNEKGYAVRLPLIPEFTVPKIS